MLNTKLNEKSALARLLATENLSVQYSTKYPTAFFDLKSRTIHIPLIHNLDEDLLDLFEGHEVGHARVTPAEGFHSAIEQNGEIDHVLKTYLNVVEDIRIERKIKNEYPGLRRSFANAYKKLVDLNFFGENLQDRINDLDFIDRLNVEAKVGAHVLIDFTDDEKALIEEAYSLETWDEVVAFAKKLMGEQAKKNKEKKEQQGRGQPTQKKDATQQNGMKNLSPEKNEGESKDQMDGPSEGEDQESDSSDSDQDGNSEDTSSVAPSQTDQSFRKSEQEMFAKAKKQDNIYSSQPASITVGKYNLNEYVVQAKDLVHPIDAGIRAMFSIYMNNPNNRGPFGFGSYDELLTMLHSEYRTDNNAYINFLVKEFEMRKNARMLNRGKIAKTGKIDVARLHKYRLSNDIFKRVTNFPEGKNHGMVMYMDLSGSMSSVLPGVFNQVLILSEFCKKVGIPFRVLGFSDSDVSMRFIRDNINPEFNKVRSDAKPFALEFKHDFHLKEYISSEMNSRDYKVAFNNILLMKAYYEAYKDRYHPSSNEPRASTIFWALDFKNIGEQLSATPLNNAIILSQQISNEFVAKYNIENMVNIFLSDGDDDHPNNIQYYGERGEYGIRTDYLNRDCKVPSMITHHTGARYIIKPTECRNQFSTYHMLKFARKVTGARYIGYFLSESMSFMYNATSHDVAANRNLEWHFHMKTLKSKYRKDKFLHSKTFGYNDYFYISNSGTINDDEDDNQWFDSLSKRHNGNVTDKNLTKGFIDKQTKRQLNRILLVHFGKALAEAA